MEKHANECMVTAHFGLPPLSGLWVSGKTLRKCTVKIPKVMQTLENIAIINDSILASVIRLSKKTLVCVNV